MLVDAVILAGAPAEPDMVEDGENISRAMVRIGSKTMLQWIVDALKSASTIGKIVVVGDVEADGVSLVVQSSSGFLENLMQGVLSCGHENPVLVMSSDIPLITAEAVDDFVGRALATEADMCYPIITRESCEDKYPGLKRTCLKTKEGTFTGGNIMLVSPAFLRRNEQQIANAYAARKKPFALARIIGVGVLMRAILSQLFFPGLLSVSMLERVVSRMLRGQVLAIQTDYPEIGEDVDKASDLEAVRAFLN